MESTEVQKQLRVLVVDDESGFLNLLQWELKRLGMSVVTATNGLEGIRRMEECEFDVVITDVTMPEMNGVKLLEAIKRSYPHTEVIVTTGFGAVETAVHAMRKGAFDFILKPYDIQFLIERIHQAMEHASDCPNCGRPRNE